MPESSPPDRIFFGVVHAHLFHRIDKQRLGLGHGLLGGLVHVGDEGIEILAAAHRAQHAFNRHEAVGQADLDLRVVHETTVGTQLPDGFRGALHQRLLQAAGSVLVGQIGQAQRPGLGTDDKQ